MSPILPTLETAAASSTIGDFLTPSELVALSSVSKMSHQNMDERLKALFVSCKGLTERTAPLDTHTARIVALVEKAEGNIPIYAPERATKLAREFFKELSLKYPLISGLKADELHSAISKDDTALITLFRTVCSESFSGDYLVQARTSAMEHGILDLYNLMQTDDYPKASKADVIARFPESMREIAQRAHVQQILESLPLAILGRAVFEEDALKPVMAILTIAFFIKEKRKLLHILDTLPEATSEEIKAKADVLRANLGRVATLQSVNFDSLINLSNKDLSTLPEEILSFSPNTLNLSGNDFRAVPDLPPTIIHLDLSRNPKIRRFAALSTITNLQTLVLTGNQMSRVPDSLAGLRLHRLDLSNNHIVAWPSQPILSETVSLKENPLIFIPYEILETMKIIQWNRDSLPYESDASQHVIDAFPFYQESLSNPTSALGKLYKKFVRPVEDYDKEIIRAALEALPISEQHLVFEMVWLESGSPTTADAQWGEHHAYDGDLTLLARAVRSAITKKLARLPLEQKARVIAAADEQAEEVHKATQDLLIPGSVLADAMERAADASFSGPLWSVSARWTCELAKFSSDSKEFLSQIEEFNSSSKSWFEKGSLLRAFEKFSQKYEQLKAEYARAGRSVPTEIEESYARVLSLTPSFVFTSTEADIIRERNEEFPPPITAANYLGADFAVEAAYHAQSQVGHYINAHLGLCSSVHFVDTLLMEISRNALFIPFFYALGIKLWEYAGSPHLDIPYNENPEIVKFHYGMRLAPARRAEFIQRFVLEQFEALSSEQKNTVYGHIYDLAGRPETSDPQWGEHHAKDSISRLADALERLRG